MSPFEIVLRFGGAVAGGYLLGSIPSGVLVSKFYGGDKDPRAFGSGKTGATNVLRTLGRRAAAMVLVGDVLKGVAAVLLTHFLWFGNPAGAQVIGPLGTSWQSTAEAIAGLAALLGHNYSIFIGFKGGRGVLTGAGAILAMQPLALAVGFVAGVTPIVLTRYVSLGSILGAFACPLADLALVLTGHDSLPHLLFMALGGAFVIYSHGDNIQRLRSGTERKLGQPASEVAHRA